MNNLYEQDTNQYRFMSIYKCPHGNFYTCNNCSGSTATESNTPNFKEQFNKDIQDRDCCIDYKHNFHFSHYEHDNNLSSTSGYINKYAIIICRHCGMYRKQSIL